MRSLFLAASFAVLSCLSPAMAQTAPVEDKPEPDAKACPADATKTSLAMLNTARKMELSKEQVAVLSTSMEGLGERCRDNPFVQLHVAEGAYALARYASPTEIVKRVEQSYTALLHYDAQLKVMQSLVANPQAQKVFDQQRSKERVVIQALYNLFIGPVMFDLARQKVDYEGFAFDAEAGCPYATTDVISAELFGHTVAINDWLQKAPETLAVVDIPTEKRLLKLQSVCKGKERHVSLVLAEGYLNLARRAVKFSQAKLEDGKPMPADLAASLAQTSGKYLDQYEKFSPDTKLDEEKIKHGLAAMREEIGKLTGADQKQPDAEPKE